jgi:flagellar hook-length control protein FliK
MQSVVTSSIIAPSGESSSMSSAKAGPGRAETEPTDGSAFAELLDTRVETGASGLNIGERSATAGHSPSGSGNETPAVHLADTAQTNPASNGSTPTKPAIAPESDHKSSPKGGPPIMPAIDPGQGETPPAKADTPVMPVIEPGQGDVSQGDVSLSKAAPPAMPATASETVATPASANAPMSASAGSSEPPAMTAGQASTPAAVATGHQSQITDNGAGSSQPSKPTPDTISATTPQTTPKDPPKTPSQTPAQTSAQATDKSASQVKTGAAKPTPVANTAAAQTSIPPALNTAQSTAAPAPILSEGEEPEPGQTAVLASGGKANRKSHNSGTHTPSFSSSKQNKSAQPGPAPSSTAATHTARPSITLPDVNFDVAASAQKPLPAPAIMTDSIQGAPQMTDNGQTTSLTTDSSIARSDAPSSAERSTQAMARFTPRAAAQLAAQITQRFNNGSRVFDIRLDPAELGRVDVRLELMPDQRVHAILTAERGETLAELQRSARDLEQALKEAGLELADSGLEFQLDEDLDQQDFDGDGASDAVNLYTESDGNAAEPETDNQPRNAYGFLLARRDYVDLRV